MQPTVVLKLLKVHVALGGDVAVGDDIVNQLVIVVHDGPDAEFNVLVESKLGLVQALADVHHLAGAGQVNALEVGEAEERCFTEELVILAVYLAEFTHLAVEVEQHAVGIVERHGHEVGVEHLLVLAGYIPDAAVFGYLVGDVLRGIDNIEGLAVLTFDDGIAVKVPPDGLLRGALVEAEVHIEVADDAGSHLGVEGMELLGLLGRQVREELLGVHVAVGQHVAVLVAQYVAL